MLKRDYDRSILKLVHTLILQLFKFHFNNIRPIYCRFPPVYIYIYIYPPGTVVAQWLRCCSTNRKVAGSIPVGVIGMFH